MHNYENIEHSTIIAQENRLVGCFVTVETAIIIPYCYIPYVISLFLVYLYF